MTTSAEIKTWQQRVGAPDNASHNTWYGIEDDMAAEITDLRSYADQLERENERLRAALAAAEAKLADSGKDAALLDAVSAIYFDDSSKYERALWNIVRHLSPSILEVLNSDPRAAYYAITAQQGEKGGA